MYKIDQRAREIDLPYQVDGEDTSVKADAMVAEVNMSFVGDWLRVNRANPVNMVLNPTAYHISFTSRTVDVSKIAEYYGGGGHANAAGATVSREKMLEFLQQVL